MRVLIDLIHLADLSFYKEAVEELSEAGHDVTFTVLRRGRLPQVAKKEFPEYKMILLGRHRSSLLGKLFSIIGRELGFLGLFLRKRFDVVTSFGFYPGFFSRLFGIRAVHFHDDKEYRMNYFLTRAFSSRFVSLCPTKESRKVRYVRSFKELSCLHPSRFKEDVSILKKLGLKSERYVYVRDIKQVSLNYASHRHIDCQPLFDRVLEKGYKVVYNAEAENNPYKGVTPIVSEYTFGQITALKRHAALVISSGDTELRESAIMGTPVIYTSGRDMLVNKPLKEAGLFIQVTSSEALVKEGLKLLKAGVKERTRAKAKSFLKHYKDMTSVILEELGA